MNHEWSYKFAETLALIMAGDIRAAAAMAETSPDLATWERRELLATVEFQRGVLRKSPKVSLLHFALWHLWTHSRIARNLMRGCLHLIVSLTMISHGRRGTYALFARRYSHDVVHYRYTNFVLGLLHSECLYVASRRAGAETSALYYQGLTGMFACLSGRFDLGLPLLDKAFNNLKVKLHTDQSCVVRERFLTTATLRMLYQSYAGNHRSACESSEALQTCISEGASYKFMEIFYHSMKMFSEVETLDSVALTKTTDALKSLVGERYSGLFALRASIYTSLIAAVQGKRAFATHHLARSDEYFSDKFPAIEIARYHFLRAIINLELGDLRASNTHAIRAKAFVSEVAGARFHRVDAGLMSLELKLRNRIRSGEGAYSTHEESDIRRQLQKLMKQTHGNALQDLKGRTLKLLLDYIQERFATVSENIAPLMTACDTLSPRMQHILKEIDIRCTEGFVVAKSPKELSASRELSVVSQLHKILKENGSTASVSAFFQTIVGSDECHVTSTPRNEMNELLHALEPQPNGDLVIQLDLQGEHLTFHLPRPISFVEIEPHVRELLELGCNLAQIAYGRERLIASERNAAVAQTTQMLAHDVRRPFSILHMGVQLLKGASSLEETKRIIELLVPEVDKSITGVEGLISDILEVGASRPKSDMTSIEPATLISQALTTSFRIHPKADIHLVFDLQHETKVAANAQKIERVLCNVIINAIQAMHRRGRMGVTTKQAGTHIEFCIANWGTYVEEATLPKLFESYFSSGKVGGTGLGLAISQKIIREHDGRIWCESIKGITPAENQVKFFFTLPASDEGASHDSVTLANHSSGYKLSLQKFQEMGVAMQERESELEDLIQANATEQPLRVLVVDDDDLHHQTLDAYVKRSGQLDQSVSITSALNLEDAMVAAQSGSFDLIVSDIDLGDADRDGFAFVRLVREMQSSALICVQSNRIHPQDHHTALFSGADTFMPKPVSRLHFLNLLRQSQIYN